MSDDVTPAPEWSVTSQTPETNVGENGQIRDGYRINIRTGEGHSGSVFVPEHQYTPDKVKPLLAAKAAALDAVGSLTHES